MPATPENTPSDAPSLPALVAFTRIEKLVAPFALSAGADYMASAADICADVLVWAAAWDGTWSDPDAAAGTTEAVLQSATLSAQTEMSSDDPLRDDDLAAQQLKDLDSVTPETVYFRANPGFNEKVEDVAAAVNEFEKAFPGTKVAFSVDEGEHELGLLVEVSFDGDAAVFADNEYNGWQDLCFGADDAVERIEALNSDPVPDLFSSLNDLSRVAKYINFNWGYVGVDALIDALPAKRAAAARERHITAGLDAFDRAHTQRDL